MPKTTLWLGSCANTQTLAVSQNTGASHVPKSVLSFGMKKQRKHQHTTRHTKHLRPPRWTVSFYAQSSSAFFNPHMLRRLQDRIARLKSLVVLFI